MEARWKPRAQRPPTPTQRRTHVPEVGRHAQNRSATAAAGVCHRSSRVLVALHLCPQAQRGYCMARQVALRATPVAPTARHACAQAPHTSHASAPHTHAAPRSWTCWPPSREQQGERNLMAPLALVCPNFKEPLTPVGASLTKERGLPAPRI